MIQSTEHVTSSVAVSNKKSYEWEEPYELTVSKEGEAQPDGQLPVMDGKSGGLEGKGQLRSLLVNNMDFL